jgi:HEPN domain-containing protein
MNRPRLFKKKYAYELQDVAREDLETARVLHAAKLRRKENILFHGQQAIEKSLKALICWNEIPVPLVHDMNELVKAIPNYQQLPHFEQLYDLTQFATIRRYEEGVAVFEDLEITAMLDAAAEILDWVDSQLVPE